MKPLHRQTLPNSQRELTFRHVDIERDLDLVWGWWTSPHVQSYWSYAVRFGPKPGTGYSKENLRTYWLSKSDFPEDFVPLIAELDGVPGGYIEDYRVAASPLAGNPLLGENDRGFHAMIGNLDFRGGGMANVIGEVIVGWQRKTYPLCKKTVMEPDAANALAIHVALKIPGAKRYGDVQLPHKKAALIIVGPAAPKIGIVGMGAVGTTAAIQLIHRLISRGQQGEIHCFEEKNEVGRGLAYSTPKDFHIMNMRTSTMSIDPARPTDFQDWLGERCKEYVPRHFFGSYLSERWSEALAAAEKHGIRVTVHREIVTDCQENRRGVLLSSATQKLTLDNVVLCLGHLPRKRSAAKFGGIPQFIECPFDFDKIESIPKNASVGIVGTSLTAVDVIFTLRAAEFTGDIHCFSRKRHLPKVQSSAKPVKLKFYNKEKVRVLTNNFKDRLWLEDTYVLLEKDFAELENGKNLSEHLFFGRRQDIFSSRISDTASVVEESLNLVREGQPSWHTILDSTSDVISLVWNQFDFEDKKRFLPRIESVWTMYRHSMPQANAERLLAIARKGGLQTHTGLVSSEFVEDRQQFGMVAQRMEGGESGVPTTKWVDFLIDATGTEGRLDHIRSELLDNMITRAQLTPHPLGGVDVDFATSRIRNRQGELSSRLYFVGQLTKGVHFYTNSYEMNQKNVQDVVANILHD